MKNVSAALAFIVAAAGFAATASAQVTWKAISFIPKNHPVMWGANAWVNDVNAALNQPATPSCGPTQVTLNGFLGFTYV